MSEMVEVEAPGVKPYQRRLTDDLKNFPVDTQRGVIFEKPVAASLVAYGRRRGWKMVQRNTQDDRICVWRVA